ncbi:S26 family signal peptidase [Candidatus Pacearchaeota archaeon]|nr:MAG: S26 family signal peptidase [Candidatus Pacearchaeota archaeon]
MSTIIAQKAQLQGLARRQLNPASATPHNKFLKHRIHLNKMRLMSNLNQALKKFWRFLNEDNWKSTAVLLLLIIIFIRFIFFPTLSFITASPVPIVIVESCSMYHDRSFDAWWDFNNFWYVKHNISKKDFEKFPFKNGLNKGDVIFVWGRSPVKQGDVIIFKPNPNSIARNPIIHRVISLSPLATKGDNNQIQLVPGNNINSIDETHISEEQVMGKAVLRIPYIGWLKLVLFEPLRPANERGFCN